MGADQSTSRNGAAAAAVRKACYYELLGVAKDAADEEIKKAYRRKALELHPDRNLHDTANATRKFAEVQTAYEILSDPQERAWYDSHREGILEGRDEFGSEDDPVHPGMSSTGPGTTVQAVLRLMMRFNSSTPMTDSSAGFFGQLNAFFAQIADEEVSACAWQGLPPPPALPAFGRSTDAYQTSVRPFYLSWSSFSTRKSFAWRDRYRLSDAPDRRIRRLMEKENKHSREEGIREYNDAVLSLLAFVKKRDPRVVHNTQTEKERQEFLRKSAAEQAARARAANHEKLATYEVPEWARSRNESEELQNDEFEESSEESVVEHIECVVCSKTFKSEKQFQAHEKSKKHVKAVQQLQRQIRKENAELELGGGPRGKKKQPLAQDEQEEEKEEDDSADERPGPEVIAQVEPDEANLGKEQPETVDVKKETSNTKDSTRNKSTRGEDSSDAFDDEYAPRSTVFDRIISQKQQAASDADATPKYDTPDLQDFEASSTSKRIGKAKLKREKKAAKLASGQSQAPLSSARATYQSTVYQNANIPQQAQCSMCQESFPSRTQLFAHIKELDHAAPFLTKPEKGGKKSKR